MVYPYSFALNQAFPWDKPKCGNLKLFNNFRSFVLGYIMLKQKAEGVGKDIHGNEFCLGKFYMTDFLRTEYNLSIKPLISKLLF